MPTENKITASEIREGLPEALRPFVLVDSAELPRTMEPIIRAFWEATYLLNDILVWNQTVNVIFGAAPFDVNVPNGNLRFTPHRDTINAYVNNLIFIDCNQMLRLKYPVQVVSFLEEFTHVVMRVKDELVVKRMVAALYAGIEIEDGKYSVPDKTDQD